MVSNLHVPGMAFIMGDGLVKFSAAMSLVAYWKDLEKVDKTYI